MSSTTSRKELEKQLEEQLKKPKILIFGTGALGSVFGGFLYKTGENVSFIGLGDHFDYIRNNGLNITGIWGDFHIDLKRTYYSIDEISDNEKNFDIILLCVKSTHTEAAIKDAVKALSPNGLILSIQNGLNNVEIISDVVGKSRTIGGRIIFGVEIPQPGTAKVTVYADKVLLGNPFEGIEYNKKLLEYLVGRLNFSGIPTDLVDSKTIVANIWGKVLYNATLNPLGAILGVSYGKLGEIDEARYIMRNLIEEMFKVIKARGIYVPYKNAEAYWEILMTQQLPATKTHHSSMYQDLSNGRKTEIDSMNGAILKYAKDLGLEVPYTEMIVKLLKSKEKIRLRM